MKAKLVPIGNSKGIRIPKAVLDQCHIESEVELEVRQNALVIRSAKKPRDGWKSAFQRMHEQEDDKLLDDVPQTEWDEKSWEW
jgi:antitoxin MazE